MEEKNITPERKREIDEILKENIDRISEILKGRGRILVRASGTEPLVRVMLEGENYDEINALAQEMADLIKERLG